jgi:hypothetical protein
MNEHFSYINEVPNQHRLTMTRKAPLAGRLPEILQAESKRFLLSEEGHRKAAKDMRRSVQARACSSNKAEACRTLSESCMAWAEHAETMMSSLAITRFR